MIIISHNFESLTLKNLFHVFNLILIMAMSSMATPGAARRTPVPRTPMVTRAGVGGGTTVPRPRIGGVLNDEAWVGGSNIAPLTILTEIGQRRPMDFRNANTVQTLCKTGITDKMGKNHEPSTISLTL